MSDCVDILLATYNGEAYLSEQIESLFAQTYPHIHIWIRDDGSTDNTLTIISQYQKKYPEKISVLNSNTNLGIRGNFNALIENSSANYVMLSDQDDIWLPIKVEECLKLIKRGEQKEGSTTPLLVHTDLTVVKNDLSVIHSSFADYVGLNLNATSLNRVLNQNMVTGCTMMMNRALINLALPVPTEVLMHDWWIALVASAFGKIYTINSPTILYRQHTSNDTGAKSYSLLNYFNKKPAKPRSTIQKKTYEQAALFLKRYGHLMNENQKNMVSNYSQLGTKSYLKQKQLILKHRFFKSGFLRNLRFLLIRN